MAGVSNNHCVDPQDRIDQLVNVVNNLSITAGDAFGKVTVDDVGQDPVEATILHDNLNLIAGTNVTLTTIAADKSITINAGATSAGDGFGVITVNEGLTGQPDVLADAPDDTVDFIAGAGIAITSVALTSVTWTNTGTLRAFKQINIPTGGPIVATAAEDTLHLTETSSPIIITGDVTSRTIDFNIATDETTISKSGGVLHALLPFDASSLGCGLKFDTGKLIVDFTDGLTCSSNHLKWNPQTTTYLNFDSSTPKKAILKWQDMDNYDVSPPQLLGHESSNGTELHFDTIQEWLKLVTGYDATKNQYLKNETGTIKWVTAVTCGS